MTSAVPAAVGSATELERLTVGDCAMGDPCQLKDKILEKWKELKENDNVRALLELSAWQPELVGSSTSCQQNAEAECDPAAENPSTPPNEPLPGHHGDWVSNQVAAGAKQDWWCFPKHAGSATEWAMKGEPSARSGALTPEPPMQPAVPQMPVALPFLSAPGQCPTAVTYSLPPLAESHDKLMARVTALRIQAHKNMRKGLRGKRVVVRKAPREVALQRMVSGLMPGLMPKQ